MTRTWIAVPLLALAAAVAGCEKQESAGPATQPDDEAEVLIYVGNSMRLPMEECLAEYRKQNPDANIVMSFGDSGDVLAARMSERGDAAVLHEPYCSQALRDGWGSRVHVVADMRPTIAVAKGNPKGVKGLKDLARDDLKVGMTDARYTTSGGLVQEALKNAGVQEQVMASNPVQNRSSGFIANQVVIGAIDAGTCWDAVARGLPDKVDLVAIEPEFMPDEFTDDGVTYREGKVGVGMIVLSSCNDPAETRAFVDFILSPAGQAIWKKHGFNPSVE